MDQKKIIQLAKENFPDSANDIEAVDLLAHKLEKDASLLKYKSPAKFEMLMLQFIRVKKVYKNLIKNLPPKDNN